MSVTASPGRAAARPRRFGSFYIAEHRFRLLRAFGVGLVVTTFGNPLIYLYSLGVGLATLVQAPIPIGDGASVSYLAYVAPALIASAAMTVAVEESTFPYMEGFKWNETFFAMNAAPITGRQIVNGITLFIAFRLALASGVYTVIAALFGAFESPWAALTVPASVVAGLAVGLVISSYTATIRDDRGQMALIGRFVVMPLFLFSGTFFPLESLPVWLQWIGWISPLWHGTQLAREASFGLEQPGWLTAVHIVYPLALVALGLWRTQNVVVRRLDR